jgi:hypothetical protein
MKISRDFFEKKKSRNFFGLENEFHKNSGLAKYEFWKTKVYTDSDRL